MLAQDIAIHKMLLGPLAQKLKGKGLAAKDLAKPKQDLPAKPFTQVATSPLLDWNTVLKPENKVSKDSMCFKDSKDSTCFKDSAEPLQGTD